MNIFIFTTRTSHHYFFIKSISRRFKIRKIFYETKKTSFPYDTSKPFTESEYKFEYYKFNLRKNDIKNINKINYEEIDNINLLNLNFLNSKDNNLAIVFGCSKILPKVFSKFNFGMLNIHRGLTNYYRGLDSEYWPIYFKDFNKLGVTIHLINKNLDTGDVFFQEKILLEKKVKIYHLRALTTLIATKGIINIIKNYKYFKLNSKKLLIKGKYFSAISSKKLIRCNNLLNKNFN